MKQGFQFCVLVADWSGLGPIPYQFIQVQCWYVSTHQVLEKPQKRFRKLKKEKASTLYRTYQEVLTLYRVHQAVQTLYQLFYLNPWHEITRRLTVCGWITIWLKRNQLSAWHSSHYQISIPSFSSTTTTAASSSPPLTSLPPSSLLLLLFCATYSSLLLFLPSSTPFFIPWSNIQSQYFLIY